MQSKTSPGEQDKQLGIIESETSKLHEIDRTRRALTEALSDAETDVTRQQQEIARVAANLGDASNEGIERQIADARSRLKELNEAKQRAATALEAFDRKCPTPEQLRAREEQLETQRGELEQRQVVERIKENMRRTFAFMFELEKLQQERAAIYNEAVDRWPSIQPGRARYAGLHQSMTGWFPSLFGPHGEFHEALKLAGKWDLELVPESHPARDAVVALQNQEIAEASVYRGRPGWRIGNV